MCECRRDNRWGVNLAVSPLPYPDRTACELAGQQWALEIGLSGVVTNGRPFICIPQVANVSAVLERRRAIATEPRQFP